MSCRVDFLCKVDFFVYCYVVDFFVYHHVMLIPRVLLTPVCIVMSSTYLCIAMSYRFHVYRRLLCVSSCRRLLCIIMSYRFQMYRRPLCVLSCHVDFMCIVDFFVNGRVTSISYVSASSLSEVMPCLKPLAIIRRKPSSTARLEDTT